MPAFLLCSTFFPISGNSKMRVCVLFNISFADCRPARTQILAQLHRFEKGSQEKRARNRVHPQHGSFLCIFLQAAVLRHCELEVTSEPSFSIATKNLNVCLYFWLPLHSVTINSLIIYFFKIQCLMISLVILQDTVNKHSLHFFYLIHKAIQTS